MMILGNNLNDACQCAAEFLNETLKAPNVSTATLFIKVIEII